MFFILCESFENVLYECKEVTLRNIKMLICFGYVGVPKNGCGIKTFT